MNDQNKTNPPISGAAPIKPDPISTGATTPSTPSGTPTPPAIGQSPSPPPTVPETADVPPPPPIVGIPQDQMSDATAPTNDPSTNPTIPPVIVTSGGKPKSGGKKRVIATILGLLLLVGSVGVGVTLVQRNQDIRERADNDFCSSLTTETQCQNGIGSSTCIWNVCDGISKTECDQTSGCFFAEASRNCLSRLNNSDGWCKDATTSPPPPGPPPPPSSDGTCSSASGSTCGNGEPGDICSGGDGICRLLPNQIGPDNKPKCNCDVASPPPPGPPPPGPPPGLTAQCLEVKVFDTEFNQLGTASLSALNPGDSVIFTVAGTTTSGTFTGARFTINGTTRSVVTQKRPGTEEFMDTVVLPEGTSLTIEAELQHSEAGFF